jgi:hypothetical protein
MVSQCIEQLKSCTNLMWATFHCLLFVKFVHQYIKKSPFYGFIDIEYLIIDTHKDIYQKLKLKA